MNGLCGFCKEVFTGRTCPTCGLRWRTSVEALTQGPSLEARRLHEAAHCVTGLQLSWSLDFVIMEADEEGQLGGESVFTAPDWFDPSKAASDPRVRARIRESILVALAGPVAQDLIGGVPPDRMEASHDTNEIDLLEEFIALTETDALSYKIECLEQTRGIVREATFRRNAEALGPRLAEGDRLTGAEVQAFLASI